jgi:hypothetical protein
MVKLRKPSENRPTPAMQRNFTLSSNDTILAMFKLSKKQSTHSYGLHNIRKNRQRVRRGLPLRNGTFVIAWSPVAIVLIVHIIFRVF